MKDYGYEEKIYTYSNYTDSEKKKLIVDYIE